MYLDPKRLLFSLLSEALAAVNGSVSLRLKGNSCNTAAACAGSFKKSSGTSACTSLSVAASFASLRLVYESLLRVEFLLTRGEHEISAAILTL